MSLIEIAQDKGTNENVINGSEPEKRILDEWNHDLMNELMTNRGCSCQDIVETNGLHNLFCAIRSLEHSWLVQVVYIILFGLIITMAIGGNSIVIWIV
ncbi:Tachykinin-like peptides receptor 99D [Trichinella spiralis]|uniref:Tachykinin-like peptides receptor 99D n=1 Tax=Trichinella spiralis TaxID=6334 RepID=A0ABR3K8B0_TRISP